MFEITFFHTGTSHRVYAMQFLDKNGKVVTEFEEVYFDELNPKFSEVTGLCLIMPRIVNW